MKSWKRLITLLVVILGLSLPVVASASTVSSNSPAQSAVAGLLDARSREDVGVWIIDGVPFAVTAVTHFPAGNTIPTGTCVSYTTDESQTLTMVRPIDNCSGPIRVAFGLIQTIPDNMHTGIWTIGDLNVQATADTHLAQYDGNFATGVCAEVSYTRTPAGNIAHKLVTSEPSHCQRGVYTNEMYGRIQTMPASLYGFWNLDGHYFAAGTATTFAGEFADNTCVHMTYYTGNGRYLARHISRVADSLCTQDSPLLQGKVYARLTAAGFPESLLGTWHLGSETFTATPHTRFHSALSSFRDGTCVHAEYVIVNGNKTLTEIGARSDNHCTATTKPEFSGFGVIEAMPATADRGGTWQINGMAFTADGRTLFDESLGTLTTGTYVELYYVLAGAGRRLTKIETHTMPASTN